MQVDGYDIAMVRDAPTRTQDAEMDEYRDLVVGAHLPCLVAGGIGDRPIQRGSQNSATPEPKIAHCPLQLHHCILSEGLVVGEAVELLRAQLYDLGQTVVAGPVTKQTRSGPYLCTSVAQRWACSASEATFLCGWGKSQANRH